MAATGPSHRCCHRRHAGSHKEEVGLRQVLQCRTAGRPDLPSLLPRCRLMRCAGPRVGTTRATAGASYGCCCRRRAGSHKEEVGLRQALRAGMWSSGKPVFRVTDLTTHLATRNRQLAVASVPPCGSCHGSDWGKPSVLPSPACRLPQGGGGLEASPSAAGRGDPRYGWGKLWMLPSPACRLPQGGGGLEASPSSAGRGDPRYDWGKLWMLRSPACRLLQGGGGVEASHETRAWGLWTGELAAAARLSSTPSLAL